MAKPKLTLVLMAVAFALAGCAGAPDGVDRGGTRALDTGTITPGTEKTLTFPEPRAYELHCDPHPFMRHKVTAQAGGAPTAHVHILDGNATAEYRFDPQNLTVDPGAVVTYHNHGALEHTASEMTAGSDHGGH